MIGLRVVITDEGHPWHGFSGKITGTQALSPITREEGWRIELDNGLSTVARGSALNECFAARDIRKARDWIATEMKHTDD